MKDLEISTDSVHDLWIAETYYGLTLHTEDATDFVQMELTRGEAEKIYEWLKEYLRK